MLFESPSTGNYCRQLIFDAYYYLPFGGLSHTGRLNFIVA
jgi:hypothetical protein